MKANVHNTNENSAKFISYPHQVHAISEDTCTEIVSSWQNMCATINEYFVLLPSS